MTVTVELRRVPEGESEPRAVAHLRVWADGRHELSDPEGYVSAELLETPLLAPGGERVTLREQPLTWARHLDRMLRTPYLVPVVVEDSEAGAQRG